MASTTQPIIPVLPLNTVLFPGMVLPLEVHKPEERQVIDMCLDRDTPFGVVLSRPDPLGFQALPHQIGTAAYITKYESVDEDHMKVRAVGSERFMVTHFYRQGAIMTAAIIPYPIQDTDSPTARALAAQLRPLVQAYLDALSQLFGQPFTTEEIPENALALACFTAIVLRVSNSIKQELLSIATLPEMLTAERHLLQHELLLVRHMHNMQGHEPPLVETPLGLVSLN